MTSHTTDPTPLAAQLLNWLQSQGQAMVTDAIELAKLESPSHDPKALETVAALLDRRFSAVAGPVKRLPTEMGTSNLIFRVGSPNPERKPVLVLGHFDTVWPVGTLAEMPVRMEGNRVYGPGVYDMKASLVLFEYALRAIQALGLALPQPVIGLLTCDEETGSHHSRELIEQEAFHARWALVLEAPLANGSLKTSRKGVGAYTLKIEGKAAHAGVEPEKGVNAFVELAHQILAIHALANLDAGTTVNIGMIEGGIATNIVPPQATAKIDVRVCTSEEAARMDRELHALTAVLPGAKLTMTGGLNRPPMVRTEASGPLYERARDLGLLLGLSLGEGGTGGGSDGNFTAALGIPTLDGLGTPGAGAHAPHEHILTDHLPKHAALLALLLLDPGTEPVTGTQKQ